MRIYSMTATFGKLSHETLTLEPGLNVIHAPNEWGKSTWCAFLLNMLYGIDTKERTKQDSLADKDRYAPWSGAPMSGSIRLDWNGKDITIERSSNARIPLGVFRAYETETGIEVPELTAANCGQTLLGVERNVFTRAGFLRLTDMPVTQDEALRRRLNNLVTTGDESGDADKLGQTLKDLKNKCRSNKANGLLPEAEAQREFLRNQLWDLQELEEKEKENLARQKQLEQHLLLLENHDAALEYEKSKENAQRVIDANTACLQAEQTLGDLKAQCAGLPEQQLVREHLRRLEQLQLQQEALESEQLPAEPETPEAPAPFAGLSGEQALQQAVSDRSAYDMLSKPVTPLLVILACVCAAAGFLMLPVNPMVAILAGVWTIILSAVYLRNKALQKRDRLALTARYGELPAEQWVAAAQAYKNAWDTYEEQLASRKALADNLLDRRERLTRALAEAEKEMSASICAEALNKFDALQEATRAWEQAKHHAEALAAVAKTVQPPKFPDTLTISAQETRQAIEEARFQQKQLQLQQGQYQGQKDALGQASAIRSKLEAVNTRISRLELYNNAIELAQNALFKATLALQRRFSPRITKRAQTLFSKLTGNRYQRITMSEDLSLQTAAENEDTLKELRRRSDGTVDQLYLALRLAVAEELTPEAPLVLDDALVRFDDDRLALAMDILKEAAQSKQVILFTCQKRETQI